MINEERITTSFSCQKSEVKYLLELSFEFTSTSEVCLDCQLARWSHKKLLCLSLHCVCRRVFSSFQPKFSQNSGILSQWAEQRHESFQFFMPLRKVLTWENSFEWNSCRLLSSNLINFWRITSRFELRMTSSEHRKRRKRFHVYIQFSRFFDEVPRSTNWVWLDINSFPSNGLKRHTKRGIFYQTKIQFDSWRKY